MNQVTLVLGVLIAVGLPTINGAENTSPSRSILMFGVHVSIVDPVLSSHLELEPGVGLVVEYVDPESPAEKYGMAKYDVLTHFEGQLLVQPNQLGSLIEGSAAGEDLKIEFIRHGESHALVVQLAVRNSESSQVVGDNSVISLSSMQVPQKRMLSVSTVGPEGSVKVVLNGESRWFSIRDDRGQKVYEGYLEPINDRVRLSDEFKASLNLIRSLEEKISK